MTVFSPNLNPSYDDITYNVPIMTLLMWIVMQKSIFGPPSHQDLRQFLTTATNHANQRLLVELQQSTSGQIDQILIKIIKGLKYSSLTSGDDIFSYNKAINGSLESLLQLQEHFSTYTRGQGKSNPPIPHPYVLQLHVKRGTETYEELPVQVVPRGQGQGNTVSHSIFVPWSFEAKHFAKSHIIPYKILETTTAKAVSVVLCEILTLSLLFHKVGEIIQELGIGFKGDDNNSSSACSNNSNGNVNGVFGNGVFGNGNVNGIFGNTSQPQSQYQSLPQHYENQQSHDSLLQAATIYQSQLSEQLTQPRVAKLMVMNINAAISHFFPKTGSAEEAAFKTELKNLCEALVENLFFGELPLSVLFHVTDYLKSKAISPTALIKQLIENRVGWNHTYYSASYNANRASGRGIKNTSSNGVFSLPTKTNTTPSPVTPSSKKPSKSLKLTLNSIPEQNSDDVDPEGGGKGQGGCVSPKTGTVGNTSTPKLPKTPSTTSTPRTPQSPASLSTNKRTIFADLFDLINNHPHNLCSGHSYTNLIIKNRVDLYTCPQTALNPFPPLFYEAQYNKALYSTFNAGLKLQNKYLDLLGQLGNQIITRNVGTDIRNDIRLIKSAMCMSRYEQLPIIWPYELEQYGGRRYSVPLLHQWVQWVDVSSCVSGTNTNNSNANTFSSSSSPLQLLQGSDVHDRESVSTQKKTPSKSTKMSKIQITTSHYELNFRKNLYVLSSIFNENSTQAITLYYQTGTDDYESQNDHLPGQTSDEALVFSPSRRRSFARNTSSLPNSPQQQVILDPSAGSMSERLKIRETEHHKIVYAIPVPFSPSSSSSSSFSPSSSSSSSFFSSSSPQSQPQLKSLGSLSSSQPQPQSESRHLGYTDTAVESFSLDDTFDLIHRDEPSASLKEQKDRNDQKDQKNQQQSQHQQTQQQLQTSLQSRQSQHLQEFEQPSLLKQTKAKQNAKDPGLVPSKQNEAKRGFIHDSFLNSPIQSCLDTIGSIVETNTTAQDSLITATTISTARKPRVVQKKADFEEKKQNEIKSNKTSTPITTTSTTSTTAGTKASSTTGTTFPANISCLLDGSLAQRSEETAVKKTRAKKATGL